MKRWRVEVTYEVKAEVFIERPDDWEPDDIVDDEDLLEEGEFDWASPPKLYTIEGSLNVDSIDPVQSEWRADPDGPRTADEWNARYPEGSHVAYYPVAGSVDFQLTRTRSRAWELANGEVVVSINGKAGGVSIRHLQGRPA